MDKKDLQISVVIAIRNEAQNIVNCLSSLKDQNYARFDFEVIIVDDNSTDDSVSLINSFIETSDISISLYELQGAHSKKEALKYGIQKAKNNIIATTDADCLLPKNWLRTISTQYNGKNNMLLGPVMFYDSSGFLSKFQTLDMLAIQGIEFGALFFNRPILNNGANLSYLKGNYIEVGGFDGHDTPSGDDVFLLEKFKLKADYHIKGLLLPDFVVLTKPENGLINFIQQRLRWSSKTKYYSDALLIYFSSIILLQNILVIFIYLGVALVEKYWFIMLFLLVTKWLIDFILLFLVASFFKRKKVLFYFIPVQIIYPLYVVFIWIASMVFTFEWKGRKYNG